MTRARGWAVVIAATATVAVALAAVHVPSPELLGAVIAGIAAALLLRSAPTLPRPASVLAQGVLGVAIGAYVRSSTLHSVGVHWLPVVAVCLATLAISILLGLVLTAVAPVDRATASIGMIAGGAAGIISISEELGADDRTVAVMQYLRVLLIVTFMPLVAAIVFHVSANGSSAQAATNGSAARAVAFVVICLAVGLPLGRLLHAPAAALLGPMIVAAALALLVGGSVARPVPDLVQESALAVIGLQVGLRFTPSSLRAAGSLLPVTMLFILALVALCALLGIALGKLAHVDQLDAYLATTPGGLYVVLATAVTGHASAGFVLAVQLLRTFLMLLAGPPLVRAIVRRGTTTAATSTAK